MKNKIKEIVKRLKQIHGTDNVVEVIINSNICLIEVHLDKELNKKMYDEFKGMYKKDNSIKCILYSSQLDHRDKIIVLIHELGHSLLHTDLDYQFLSKHTLFNRGKYEKQANMVCAEWLISDEFLREYGYLTEDTASTILGVPVELIRLKLEGLDRNLYTYEDIIIP